MENSAGQITRSPRAYWLVYNGREDCAVGVADSQEGIQDIIAADVAAMLPAELEYAIETSRVASLPSYRIERVDFWGGKEQNNLTNEALIVALHKQNMRVERLKNLLSRLHYATSKVLVPFELQNSIQAELFPVATPLPSSLPAEDNQGTAAADRQQQQ